MWRAVTLSFDPGAGPARQRCAIRVRGRVQGVGFRPAMWRLAAGLGLDGFVRNDTDGVWIEIEGSSEAIARFHRALPAAVPAVACIEQLETTPLEPLHAAGFHIFASPKAGA